MYQFFPYIILSVISFVMIVYLGVYSMHNRQNLVVKEFIFGLVALGWWVFCQAFELMALTLDVKLFWANMLYIGAMLSSFAYLMLALRFTGKDMLLTKKTIGIALALIAAFLCLIFTDHYHGLMRTNISLDASEVPFVIAKDYGMLYPLYMFFLQGANLTSMGLILSSMLNKYSVYRRKAQVLFVGLSVIPLSNLAYILGLSPVKRFDITPALFWISALVVSWGIFQHKLLNIMPLARDLLVEIIGTGIIVADGEGILVDINGAALKMFDLEKSMLIGRNLAEIPELANYLESQGEEETIVFSKAGKRSLLNVKRQFLRGVKWRKVGTLWVIDDITVARANMEKIVEQEKTLTVMNERERVARSLHDGLGQVFGYYNTQGQAVKEYLDQNKIPLAMKYLAELIEVSRNHHQMIRDQISDIRGVPLANKSFTSALKQYITEFGETHSIPVSFSLDYLPEEFPDDLMAVELLKIVQEAMQNINKHAGACSAKIDFRRMKDHVLVTVSDNGRGFDVKGCSDGYGLAIMRERAAVIGATMAIESEQGNGTKLVFKVWDGGRSENCHSR